MELMITCIVHMHVDSSTNKCFYVIGLNEFITLQTRQRTLWYP